MFSAFQILCITTYRKYLARVHAVPILFSAIASPREFNARRDSMPCPLSYHRVSELQRR